MQILQGRMDHSLSTPLGVSNMITIIEAYLECYAPNDYGMIYRFSDGGIGGRSIRSFDEAVREANRINVRSLIVQSRPIAKGRETVVSSAPPWITGTKESRQPTAHEWRRGLPNGSP
jgi:hypothetical protein